MLKYRSSPVDIADLEMRIGVARGERRDMDHLPLWIDLHRPARPLFGDERVAIGEPLAAEDLRRRTGIVKHRLPA